MTFEFKGTGRISFDASKGQLILKCLCGVFNSPKEQTKTWCSILKPSQNKKGQKIFQLHGAAGNFFGPSYFDPALVKSNFLFVFWKNWRYVPKRCFEINWPLRHAKFSSASMYLNYLDCNARPEKLKKLPFTILFTIMYHLLGKICWHL